MGRGRKEGHTVSLETRDKIRKSLIGRKLPKEIIEKIRKSLKGRVSPMKGRLHPRKGTFYVERKTIFCPNCGKEWVVSINSDRKVYAG